jgi:hypothetical protein
MNFQIAATLLIALVSASPVAAPIANPNPKVWTPRNEQTIPF